MAFNPNSFTQNMVVKAATPAAAFLVNNFAYPAGYIPLNGSGSPGASVAQLQTYGPIIFVSGSDVSGVNFTITGLDLSGNVVTEVLAGPNNTSASSVNSYWRITSIVPSASNPLSAGSLVIGQAVSTGVGNYSSLTVNVPLNITASSYASATSINIASPAFLTITAAGNESANTFTIIGIDVNGNPVISTILGPTAAGTVIVQVAYKSILSIQMQNAAAGLVEIGVAAQTYTQWVPIDKNSNQFEVGVGVYLSAGATLNYTVQFAYLYPAQGIQLVQDDTVLANETTSGTTLVPAPFDAVRLLINSYTDGEAIFMVRPTGLSSAGYPILLH